VPPTNERGATSPLQVNAGLAEYVGFDAWKLTTAAGGSIKAAIDFTMTVLPMDEAADELFPSVGAGAAVYGDPNGTYAAFLSRSQQDYPSEPWFFWDQPLSDSGWVRSNASGTGTGTAPTPSASSAKNSSARTRDEPLLQVGAAIIVLIHVLLFA